MLNSLKKNANNVSLIIITIICIILLIILDMYFFNTANINEISNRLIYTCSTRVEKNNNIKRQSTDAIKIDDTFQELMQIADIYNDDTLIAEIEDNSEETEITEDESNIQAKSNINTNKDTSEITTNNIEQILDKENKWRIKIPKINVDAPIKTGTSQEVLALSVGHFPDTTTWNGNVALAGHNRGYRCNFFQDIKKLKIGDKIIYSTPKGERTYKVILNKIIKQTDWTYVQGTNDNRITLITCVENMHDYRRCVQAVEGI